MSRKLTRRELLRFILAGATTAALSPVLHARAHYPTLRATPQENGTDVFTLMGRAIYTTAFYEEPDRTSARLDTRHRDQSFRILGETHAPYSAHNDRWYETTLGYVHSAWVQPMRIYAPQPCVDDAGEWGFWGEVSQVYTSARSAPSVEARELYRIYGGTVYHVVAVEQDEQDTGWYQIIDDYPPKTRSYQWILARDMRRAPRAEIAPIHPFVGDKRIEVDLGAQLLTCFEGEEIIFTTKVASGMAGATETPRGAKAVLLKQASRHMSNVPYPGMPEELLPASPEHVFDLPGVPWNTFFDMDGSAIHGAYWHNDFGVRRSHGCVNVPCEAARWVYRWTHPIGGFEDDFIRSNHRVGTPILIF